MAKPEDVVFGKSKLSRFNKVEYSAGIGRLKHNLYRRWMTGRLLAGSNAFMSVGWPPNETGTLYTCVWHCVITEMHSVGSPTSLCGWLGARVLPPNKLPLRLCLEMWLQPELVAIIQTVIKTATVPVVRWLYMFCRVIALLSIVITA